MALDLDGTVVREDLSIAESTIEAVGRAKRTGLFVVVATGRMFRSAAPHVARLGVTEPVIAYNGALVKNANGAAVGGGESGRDRGADGADEGGLLLHKPLPLEVAVQVARWCQSERLTLNVYLDDELYVAQRNEAVRHYESIAGVEAQTAGDLVALLEETGAGPTKLLVVSMEGADVQTIAAELERRFRSELHIAQSQGRFVEMTHPEATKGRALAWLAARLGIERGEVLAVGDSFNDVEMLEFAGVGAAMAAAPEEIRRRADVTVATVEEAIERFAL